MYRILDWRIGLRNLSLSKALKRNWGVGIQKNSIDLGCSYLKQIWSNTVFFFSCPFSHSPNCLFLSTNYEFIPLLYFWQHASSYQGFYIRTIYLCVILQALLDKLIFMFYLVQDHAGHILGVDSVPMIEKLEQYNEILDVSLLATYIFFLVTLKIVLNLHFASRKFSSMFVGKLINGSWGATPVA